MKIKKEVEKELWCQALEDGHTMQYRATGRSMRPFIKSGSTLTVEPTKEISFGDVIAYESNHGLVTHRVIGKGEGEADSYYITKGDNSSSKDGPVRQSKVLGKVIRIEKEGKVVRMDSFPFNFFNVITACLSPLMGYLLFAFRKVRNKLLLKGSR